MGSVTHTGMIYTTMQAGRVAHHQPEEKETNSSCHVVEDYLTNPYRLDHHIRVRSVSGSDSCAIPGPGNLYKKQRSAEESGSFRRTPVMDRLSSFRSRASSLSSYLSSSSSTLPSMTLSSMPSRSSLSSPSSTSQSTPFSL